VSSWITKPRNAVIVAAAVGAGGLVAITQTGGGGPSGVCDVNATTGNFSTQVAATNPGQMLCLASGSYGSWTGTNKASPGITIKEQSGATATFDGLNFQSGASGGPVIGGFTLDGIDYNGGNVCAPAHDITVKNAEQKTQFNFQTGASSSPCSSGPAMDGTNNLVWDNINATVSGCPTGSCLTGDGRITVWGEQSNNNNSITIRNSQFHGNCADGIDLIDGGLGVTIGPGNHFYNIAQGSCGPHVDSIQWNDGSSCRTVVTGNYFDGVESGVVDYGAASNSCGFVQITKNVFNDAGTGGTPGMCVSSSDDLLVEHNVFAGSTTFGVCGNHGTSSNPSLRTTWRNNIQAGNGTNFGCGASCTYVSGYPNYDLCTTGTCTGANSLNGTPTYVGGATPSSYAGWFITAGSLGHAAGHDGSDMGLVP